MSNDAVIRAAEQRAQDGMMQLAIDSAVERAVSEARADEARKCAADVCAMCRVEGWQPAERINGMWQHRWQNERVHDCAAGPIHERLAVLTTKKDRP